MSDRDHRRTRKRAATGAQSVLVVDDNQPNRILMEALLTGLGCATMLAGGGAEALEIAERHRFDLILMDIHMPRMDGIETLNRLRAGTGASAATPVIALTADAAASDHAAFRTAGIAAVLVKPISPTSLAAAINALSREPANAPDLDPPAA